jgi:hypothetical protein
MKELKARIPLMLRGLLAGTLLAAGLALWDGIANRGYRFGLVAMLFGVTAGAGLLAGSFMIAAISFWLASHGRAVILRRWLLTAAVVGGAAGMSCGFLSAALWFAAGRPWFP